MTRARWAASFAVVACLLPGPARAQGPYQGPGEPMLGSPQDRPIVKRPSRNTCYDPENRVACLTACAGDARCAAACPPKLCSRGGGPD